jgi:hypothetical protein
VTRLCSVKRVNVGKVTAKLDQKFETNTQRAQDRRESKRKEEKAAALRKITKKSVKFNNALEEPLAPTIGELLAQMSVMGNTVGVCKDYLKRQYNARLMRAEKDEFNYPTIGDKYRANTKKRKMKMTPSDNENEIEYLQELVILMMKADSRRGAIDNEEVSVSGLVQKVPTLNVHLTNARALKLRKDMEDRVCLQAAQGDNPWLVFLTDEYVGKICFLHDIAERHKLAV